MRAATGRLEHALRRAAASRNEEAWISTAIALNGAGGRMQDVAAGSAALLDVLAPHLATWRSQLRSRGARLWVGQQAEGLTSELLRDALARGPTAAQAIGWFEMLRARTLLDEICLPFEELSAGPGAKARAIEADLLRFEPDPAGDILDREMQLLSELPLGGRDRADIARMRVEAIEAIYTEEGGGFSGVQAVASLDEIQQRLDPGEVLIEYFIPHHHSHAAIELWGVLVTRDGSHLLRAPLELLPDPGVIMRMEIDGKPPQDVSPLGLLVGQARQAIQETNEQVADAALALLDEVLLAPFKDNGLDWTAVERLLVIPHRVLHAIPWTALLDRNGDRLAQRAAIGNAPSASVLGALRSRPAVARTHFLGLADPELADPGLEPLQDARVEVAEVGANFRRAGLHSDVLAGKEASETALRLHVKGRAIVELATHAGFPEQDALDLHTLKLARTAEHDGDLTAGELRTMDFGATWLTILSVCDGALYRVGPGDEPYGLMRALVVAGSRNAIATLWEVDGDSARQLIVAMSAVLLEVGPAEALRRAEMPKIGPWPVQAWAPFVLVGACR